MHLSHDAWQTAWRDSCALADKDKKQISKTEMVALFPVMPLPPEIKEWEILVAANPRRD
jgi:hypothetical protein